ncbi:hypothetical protein ACVZJ6_03395 [Citrobacter portucalensis]
MAFTALVQITAYVFGTDVTYARMDGITEGRKVVIIAAFPVGKDFKACLRTQLVAYL